MLGKHSPNWAVSSLSLSHARTPFPWEKSFTQVGLWNGLWTFRGCRVFNFTLLQKLVISATPTSQDSCRPLFSVSSQQIRAVCVLHIVSSSTLAGPSFHSWGSVSARLWVPPTVDRLEIPLRVLQQTSWAVPKLSLLKTPFPWIKPLFTLRFPSVFKQSIYWPDTSVYSFSFN